MVLLVFRDPARRGTSVEEIYNGIRDALKEKLNIQIYYYQDQHNTFWNIREIQRYKASVIHVTSDMYFIVPFIKSAKKIITIHDIGRYHELSGLKKWIYKWFWLSIPARQADIIITVSDFTSQDVLQHISRNLAKKIIRIYNPLPKLFKPGEKEFNADRPILLQVGTIPNKNIESVIRALEDIPCHLVLIGRLSKHQIELLDQYKIQYSNHFGLKFSEVYALYASSDIIVFVSTFEGFGMPVIEANAAGKPVICSAAASLPEIAGKAALLVQDPGSISEINAGIKRLISDKALRQTLIKEGYENIRRFDFSDVVTEYEKLYTSLLIP